MSYPAYTSGLYAMSARVRRSDRHNAPGEDMTEQLSAISVDADIDRSGAKGQMRVTAYQPGVLAPNQWLAPSQIITPEVGDVQDVQMGLYQLGQPEVTVTGTAREDTTAIGSDPINVLAEATLPAAFRTPVLGNLMADVITLIKMGTLQAMGPNLLTNGSFENNAAGWTQGGWEGGASGTIDRQFPISPAPHGSQFWGAVFAPNQPAGAYTFISQIVTIPRGVTRMYALGACYETIPGHRGQFDIWMARADGSITSHLLFSEPGPAASAWHHKLVLFDVPADATRLTFIVRVADVTGGADRAASCAWDDVSLGQVIGEPIDDRMINLPRLTTKATSRRQDAPGATYLSAINTRLEGLGYHALYCDNRGVYTTRPVRDVSRDRPSRVYTLGTDARLAGELQITRSTSSFYNVVTAIKEDVEAGETMSATATNDDVADPWSVRNTRTVGVQITVQDAVSVAELQAAADAHLRRATMQEELTLQVMPDPALAVHEVIELRGPAGSPVVGKWAIESLAPGMTADDPLITIGARRSVRR